MASTDSTRPLQPGERAAADRDASDVPAPVVALLRQVARALDERAAWAHAERVAPGDAPEQFRVCHAWLAERAGLVHVAVADDVAKPRVEARALGWAAEWLAGRLDAQDRRDAAGRTQGTAT